MTLNVSQRAELYEHCWSPETEFLKIIIYYLDFVEKYCMLFIRSIGGL